MDSVVSFSPIATDAAHWSVGKAASRASTIAAQQLVRDCLNAIPKIEGITRRGARSFPHPFPARMPLEVARTIVETISNNGDIVADPMMGSGTTIKAAVLSNRHGLGFDLDPLSPFLANAYCAPVPHDILRDVGAAILDRAVFLEKHTSADDFLADVHDAEDRKFLEYWFPASSYHRLFCLVNAIDEIANPDQMSMFAALFSSIIISRESGASFALDLSRSRPHKSLEKVVRDPFDLWKLKLREFVRFSENHQISQGNLIVGMADGRSLPLGDNSIDAVITSPPYLNAIDYIRTSKFSLVFFGQRLSRLREIRKSSVGTETGLRTSLPEEILEGMVTDGVADPARRPLVRRYLADMLSAISESFRVLKPGGRAIYVVGPSILSRSRYDGGEVFAKLASLAGYDVIGVARRDLSAANRSLPPPRRNNRSAAINQRMTCELYVGMVKPS
ncbi:DNA methyltransferase [Azospirillum argentinense]|uniref:DNA methyltransferase n=1 Tax=Azospirillum argentinense TaxID=2970906 RepID=UPI0018DDCB0C|nr:DNA methyltransferase [Azospirillum argentinense]